MCCGWGAGGGGVVAGAGAGVIAGGGGIGVAVWVNVNGPNIHGISSDEPVSGNVKSTGDWAAAIISTVYRESH
jgi:hypothetical protein